MVGVWLVTFIFLTDKALNPFASVNGVICFMVLPHSKLVAINTVPAEVQLYVTWFF